MRRREFIRLMVVRRFGRCWRVRRSPSAYGASGAAARSRGRRGISDPCWCVPAGIAASGLDHRPQREHRHPLGHDRCRRDSQARGGIGRARTRRHSGPRHLVRGALLQATRAVPIVFVIVVDPVGAGFVASLARPGGNATGFMQFECSLSVKWPELLKDMHRELHEWRSFGIPPSPPGSGSSALSSPRPHRSGWKRSRLTSATPAKSNSTSQPLRVPRMAALS